jgi:hypothetical protein
VRGWAERGAGCCCVQDWYDASGGGANSAVAPHRVELRADSRRASLATIQTSGDVFSIWVARFDSRRVHLRPGGTSFA